MTEPEPMVTITVPGDCSVVQTPDGHMHTVAVDAAGRRTVTISAAHARVMLNSGLECSLAWKAVNAELAARLGPMPKLEPGVRVADLLQAAADAAPRDPRDVGGMVRDTLRAVSALRE